MRIVGRAQVKGVILMTNDRGRFNRCGSAPPVTHSGER
jgi:hypothetical protein